MKEYRTILLDRDIPVLKVTFNRPHKANAFSTEMISELTDLFTWLRNEVDTKYVVFTGQGRTFSSGIDLSEVFLEIESHPTPHVKSKGYLAIRLTKKIVNASAASHFGTYSAASPNCWKGSSFPGSRRRK
ncbi:MAG: enoyl-CoA hydratase-related protein [Bacillota bacterium]